MEIVSESTSQGNPSNGNPSPFPPFGNISGPYMETFSISIFTIGFLVWLFSTPMVLNVQTASQLISPPREERQPHVDPKVEPFPSSPMVSSPLSPSSPGESIDSSNMELRKRRRSKISKGITKKPLLHIQLVWRNLPISPTK